MLDPPKLLHHLIVMLWNKNVHTPTEVEVFVLLWRLDSRQVMPDIFIVSVCETAFNYLNLKSMVCSCAFYTNCFFNSSTVLDLKYSLFLQEQFHVRKPFGTFTTKKEKVTATKGLCSLIQEKLLLNCEKNSKILFLYSDCASCFCPLLQ